mgnify:CR=1 FL=1
MLRRTGRQGGPSTTSAEPDIQALYAQRNRMLAERRKQQADMQVQ